MKIIMIGLALLLGLLVAFVIAGILVYKRNLKKDKYDLLDYLKKQQDLFSITIKEDGQERLTINSEKRFPLASTMKIIVAYNFIISVKNGSISLTEKIALAELDKLYIKDTDGGAHPDWKKSLNSTNKVELLDVAKGMMQFSSNACTDFLINKIGIDVINKRIEELQLNHDKITYLTSPILIPAYLSDQAALAKINEASYQNLSSELLELMKKGEAEELKEQALKIVNNKMQLSYTQRMASSTTNQYADLMDQLGEIFTEQEKELFSEIVIGNNLKEAGDIHFWYKGGSTLFVLTSALYKETEDHTLAVSLFIKDDAGGELYWMRNIFRDFVISIAKDAEFKEKVEELAD